MNSIAPAGCTLLQQSQVTPAMTAWAVAVLNDLTKYPMYAFTVNIFGSMPVLAHVEWHPPDANNAQVHRGVTLYAIPNVPTEGIDISGFQPTVNWAQVVASGKVFAFIKASEGTTLVDSQFAQHWANAKSTGILRGAYHFFRPEVDPVAQAQHFLAQLAGDKGELPPVLDVEVVDNTPLPKIAAAVSTWVEYVNANYGRPLIYTMPGFWDLLPAIPSINAAADVWVAHWGVSAPSVPTDWSNWTFWQYTNKASVAGIPGTSDMDDNRFNGSYGGLLAYASGSVTPVPSPPVFNLDTTKGVQEALNYIGENPPLAEDGVYGPKSKTAVEKFQKSAGLTQMESSGQKRSPLFSKRSMPSTPLVDTIDTEGVVVPSDS